MSCSSHELLDRALGFHIQAHCAGTVGAWQSISCVQNVEFLFLIFFEAISRHELFGAFLCRCVCHFQKRCTVGRPTRQTLLGDEDEVAIEVTTGHPFPFEKSDFKWQSILVA